MHGTGHIDESNTKPTLKMMAVRRKQSILEMWVTGYGNLAHVPYL